MNEDELRAMIRTAVEKHLGNPSDQPTGRLKPASISSLDLSFAQYPLDRADGDTSCLIEPAVRCNHCGFCKCHGH